MAINSVDDIASGLANSKQHKAITKILTAAKSAGAVQSGWMGTGTPSAGVASPVYTAGSGYTCSSATTGAIQLTNGSVQLWLARAAMSCSQPGTIILVDRLWSCSGMGCAAATYKVTTPGSLPARITDSGVGCEIWCEQFVAAGAASGTLTVTYLDTGGSSSTGVISAVTSAPVTGQLQPVPLASGDVGVSQIVSAANSATWTSGTYGITVVKRIAEFPATGYGIGSYLDWASLALPTIPNDACLMLMYIAQNTSAATIIGSLDIIDK